MAYQMTPARRRALRKAQAASARKRRGKGKGKLAAANRRATRNKRIAQATGGLAGAAILAGYASRNYKGYRMNEVRLGESAIPSFSFGRDQVGVEFGRGRRLYGAGIRRRKVGMVRKQSLSGFSTKKRRQMGVYW